jgi:hypothetical protein
MVRLISPDQTISTARKAGLGDSEVKMTGIAVLTFSKEVVLRLEERCLLRDAKWISPSHHPYAAPRIVKRGTFQGLDVTVLVPPMGASPLACTLEDLVACGVGAVFLVCAAWSLGPPLKFGDLVVPTFSIGPDGTSIHYGNDEGEVHTKREVIEVFVEACRALDIQYRVGGNGTCEALYRITPQMVEGFRKRGCLCMDNGEANTLISATRMLDVFGGVLFQPYIDLGSGWDPAALSTEQYRKACLLQADVVLEAGSRLLQQSAWEE